ncbi:MAG: helix-turn-helix domain-containing protein [Myxococcota bacterium]|nr:helix-turn-helix domain-containing protein [Myxococcota bacterium]
MSAAPAREPAAGVAGAAGGKGEATRRRIVAEARRTLIADGYDALSLRGVATRLHIRVGNLQYYFASRDELLLEVIRQEAREDALALRAALDRAEDPEAGLGALVRTLVRRWRSDGGLVFIPMQLLARHKPAFREAYRQIYDAFYAEMERAIEAVDPKIEPAERATRARLLTALIDGASMQIRVGPKRGFLAALTASALAIAQPRH